MLKIGDIVDGKYKILEQIGRGGMSNIYMALNEKANKTWAIKVVRKDEKANVQMGMQNLTVEVDILKKLKHRHLPTIIDVIDYDDELIMVMDYIEGRSLDKIIAETGAQSEENVVKWSKQICDVLMYLHSFTPPIIYRDMKPSNVMLKPDGDIMVIDFGTAKREMFNDGQTVGLGTNGYAAPEQSIGNSIGRSDGRSDIYCLGMTMYHLLTNISPSRHLIEDKSIRSINPSFSQGLDAIIQKCTQYLPVNRYQSCEELLYDLENYEMLEPVYRRKQKSKMAIFTIFVFLTIIFLFTGLGIKLASTNMATDLYETKLDEATKANQYQNKVDLYEECIDIPNKSDKKEAYLGMIQTFKEDDAKFSVEEEEKLVQLIDKNIEELKKNRDDYIEICFETGKLYWYYYDYANGSKITRAISSIGWFEDVINNAPNDYPNKGMADVYMNIGVFYRNITTDITEANDEGKYIQLFENLDRLINEVASDQQESEIVRLELLELTRSAMEQYATKFKTDGVSEGKLIDLYNKVNSMVKAIDTTSDKTTDLKDAIMEKLNDTKESINKAYCKEQGGNEL